MLITKAFVVPLLLHILLLVLRMKSWKTWFLLCFMTVAWTMPMLLFVDWAEISQYLRVVLILLSPTAIAFSIRTHRGIPWSRKASHKYINFGQWLLLAAGILYCLLLLSRITEIYFFTPRAEAAVEIEFPLRGGIYSVSHGGHSTTLNYHFAYPNQTYAIDIVKLNKWGMRKNPFSRSVSLQNYAIYGEPVYSPVDGKVVKTVTMMSDELKDRRSLDKSSTANMVIIKHQDIYISLLHLQKGSLRIKEGDNVKKGQWIANVGNSGYSSEPHLHLHAVKIPDESTGKFNGSPVLLLVNGVSPKRNDLILDGRIIFR